MKQYNINKLLNAEDYNPSWDGAILGNIPFIEDETPSDKSKRLNFSSVFLLLNEDAYQNAILRFGLDSLFLSNKKRRLKTELTDMLMKHKYPRMLQDIPSETVL